MDRFGKHFFNITKSNMSVPVGKHCNLPHHEGLEDAEIYVLDFIHSPNLDTLLDLYAANTMDVKNY